MAHGNGVLWTPPLVRGRSPPLERPQVVPQLSGCYHRLVEDRPARERIHGGDPQSSQWSDARMPGVSHGSICSEDRIHRRALCRWLSSVQDGSRQDIPAPHSDLLRHWSARHAQIYPASGIFSRRDHRTLREKGGSISSSSLGGELARPKAPWTMAIR